MPDSEPHKYAVHRRYPATLARDGDLWLCVVYPHTLIAELQKHPRHVQQLARPVFFVWYGDNMVFDTQNSIAAWKMYEDLRDELSENV